MVKLSLKDSAKARYVNADTSNLRVRRIIIHTDTPNSLWIDRLSSPKDGNLLMGASPRIFEVRRGGTLCAYQVVIHLDYALATGDMLALSLRAVGYVPDSSPIHVDFDVIKG